jgi:hypothetical protein
VAQKFDETTQKFVETISAELPRDLQMAASFKPDLLTGGLLLDFAIKLDSKDYPDVLHVVKKYNGDLVNRKEKGQDIIFFAIPIPRPQTPKKQETPTQQSNASVPQTQPVNAPKPAPATQPTASAPKAPITEQNNGNGVPSLQLSPFDVYKDRYCSTCRSQSTCTSRAECIEILKVLFLDDLREQRHRKPQPAAAPQNSNSSNSGNSNASNGKFVVENGVIWENGQTAECKPCQKAFEHKNSKNGAPNTEYLNLQQEIISKKAKPDSKGAGFGGYWYYIVNESSNPYIARINTKTRAA